MLLKRYILGLLFCSTSLVGFSQFQREPLHLLHYDYLKTLRFGFTIGLNVLDFSTVNTFDYVMINPGDPPTKIRADVVTMSPGFSLNGIIDYRIARNLNLRALPGICFGSRELRFYNDELPGNVLLHAMPIVSNYVELPLHVKYSAKRHSNFRPYVIAGINIRSSLTYKSKVKDGVYFDFAPAEPFYEFGFGFDSYLPYTKISIELKISKGVEDVLAKRQVQPGYEPYLEAIGSLKSQMIQLSFHFE